MDKEFSKKCLTEVESKVKETPKTALEHRRLFKKGYSLSKLP
jgi:hypothetical protein